MGEVICIKYKQKRELTRKLQITLKNTKERVRQCSRNMGRRHNQETHRRGEHNGNKKQKLWSTYLVIKEMYLKL